MKIKDLTKQYNSIGYRYNTGQKFFYNHHKDEASELIKKFITNIKDKVVLDVGCGNGHNIIKYEKMGAKMVHGLDTSKTMVDEAKKNR